MISKGVCDLQIDKKNMRNLLLCVLSGILLYWGLTETDKALKLITGAWGLIAPFVAGAVIAFIFNVPMRAVENEFSFIRKEGLRRLVAIIVTLMLFALVVAFVFLLLIPQITLTVESIVDRLPDFVKREVNNLMNFLDNNPEVKEIVLQYTNLESIDWTTVIQKIVSFIGERVSTVFDGAFSAIGSVTSAIVNTLLSIIFALYALSRKEILARQGRRLVYSLLPEKTCDGIIRVVRLSNTTFSNFISGQCLEAVILGAMFAVGMAVLKLPYIALVSVIIAVTALVPLVGAFIGCALGCLFILVDSPVQALTFLVLFLVLQQIEGNLIYPKVVGTSIGLPGMWVLVAVSVGSELMGIMGMLVMIPLASVLYTLLREFTQKRIMERNIPGYKLMDQPPELRSRFKENRERRQKQRMELKLKALVEKTRKK